MYAAKVEKKNAQKAKQFLLEKNMLELGFFPSKDDDCIYFALNGQYEGNDSFEVIEKDDSDFKKLKQTPKTLKEALADDLSSEELDILKTSYDQIGDIAILEIDDPLIPKQELIAKRLLETQPQIKVVCKKAGVHGGTFRTQEMEIIAGENRFDTIHHENGIRLKMKVSKVYFSPRLSTERGRINDLIGVGEDVLVCFSGSGVYPVNISRNTKAKHIVGVEINPEGHNCALENKKMNHCANVDLYNGDVNDILPTLKEESFDRILMPLPKSAADFLDIVLTKARVGTVIHMYDFLHEDEFKIAWDKIDAACKRASYSYEITKTVKCGQHAPRVYRICVDFKLTGKEN